MQDQEEHPLQSSWSIWELRESNKGNYGDNLHKLGTFSTVEQFWGYWNNIPKPSAVLYDGVSRKKFSDRSVQSFGVFKEGIRPEWEDPANCNGGEWQIPLKLQAGPLDAIWDRVVLGLIGETIDPASEITGARVIHKLWLRSRDRNLADEIRAELLACMNDESSEQKVTRTDCSYKDHRH